MTLFLPKGPRGGRARAAARLAAIPGLVADGDAPLIYKPIALYGATTVRLADADAPLTAIAECSGWRYLTSIPAGLALVDLFDDPTIGSAVSVGPAADALNRAALFAEERADSTVDFEVRYFAAGELGFEALWLHGGAVESFAVDLSANELDLIPLNKWLVAARRDAATRFARQQALR